MASSTFSPEIANAICARLEAGESLRTICASDGMPHRATVHRWLDEHESFRDQYARARDKGLDVLADEILEIANTPHEGTVVTSKEWGEEIKTGDMLEHRKLQVDARKWYLSKLAPKRYGDRLHTEHSGEVSVTGLAGRMRNRRPAAGVEDLV